MMSKTSFSRHKNCTAQAFIQNYCDVTKIKWNWFKYHNPQRNHAELIESFQNDEVTPNEWILPWRSKQKIGIVAWPPKVRSSTTLASVTSKKVTYVGRLVNLLSVVPSIKNTSLTIQCSPARPQPTWKIHIEYHTKAITLNLPHSQKYLQNMKIFFWEVLRKC